MNSKDNKVIINTIFFVCTDSLAVALAAIAALWIRFDFSYTQIPSHFLSVLWRSLPFLVLSTITLFVFFRLYSILWVYAGAAELLNITTACVLEVFFAAGGVLWMNEWNTFALPRSFYIIYGSILWFLVFFSRYVHRALRSLAVRKIGEFHGENVLIIGAGSAGSALIREINTSHHVDKKIVGLIDDDARKIGSYIQGLKVLGDRNDIIKVAEKYNVDEIFVVMPSASSKEIKDILDICKETGCKLKRLPGMYQLLNDEISVSALKNVDVNDLLGREPVQVDLDSILGYVSNKTVLVTGGGGSIGSELCRQIAAKRPKQLILLDIYENSTYEVQNELHADFPFLHLTALIASVRNTNRINQIFRQYRPDIVYHAAAHKHVPLMEDSPNEAIKNNVLGTWKVVQAADKWQVNKFVMISTDKAVNPTNIMGASKRIGEMIIQTYNNHSDTEFVAVRFGNVLGSNGSAIPLFQRQIENGGPVTVTHPDIIRYFMTIPEAVSLVLQAGAYAKGGEIFVLDMGEPVKIVDLARNLILLSGHKPDEEIKIEFTGLRPGEKLYEEMLMDEECMQKTDNELIYIGFPIKIDEDAFMKQLDDLREYVVKEPDDIKEWVARIVPTYMHRKG